MPVEIEKRFLIKKDYPIETLLKNAPCVHIVQGYILNTKEKIIRVRIQDNSAFFCCKKSISALERLEFEYSIPYNDALSLLENMSEDCYIEKKRYHIYYHSNLWEIDYFLKENRGLIIAEVELKNAEEDVILPEWVGKEVTEDFSFTNASLSKKPFTTWKSFYY